MRPKNYSLKDILQTLVDVGAFKLRPEQKTVSANATSCLQFGLFPPTLTTISPILAMELQIINTDRHRCHGRGLVPVLVPDENLMWVHHGLIKDDGQWTTVTSKKSSGKGKDKAKTAELSMPPPENLTRMTSHSPTSTTKKFWLSALRCLLRQRRAQGCPTWKIMVMREHAYLPWNQPRSR